MDYQARPDLTVEARLVLIENMVGRMDQKLFGNGQQGELADMYDRISKLETSDHERNGQKAVWGLLGAVATLAIGLAALLLGRV